MEAEIEASDLDWTLVRPPTLTDGEKTGVSRAPSREGGEKAHKIGRADARQPSWCSNWKPAGTFVRQ